MRGEDPRYYNTSRPSKGSPPHARGRQRRWTFVVADGGITPACAGKTDADGNLREQFSDHPRMRGEDHHGVNVPGDEKGSPPHARGRRKSPSGHLETHRITPACAGKT